MPFEGWIDSVKDKLAPSNELKDWKKAYIDFLMEKGVMKFGSFKLKSGRRSPTFLNFGDISDGSGVAALGKYYYEGINEKVKSDFKTIIGPSYKGIPLAVTTAIAFAQNGKNVSFTFDRKEEKSYGEGTDATKETAAKRIFVGYIPNTKSKDKVLYLDDVITTGLTKIEEDQKVKSVADVDVVGLIVGANRQELDENGNDAMKELAEKLKTPVDSLLNVYTEAIPYLWNKKTKAVKENETIEKDIIDDQAKRRLVAYARAYGTEDVKGWCRNIKLIEKDKGLIPAADVPLEVFETLVKATHDIDQVVAYKIPAMSGRRGWETWIQTARKYTDKPLIYDHQKAANDIPDIGKDFMREVKEAGFNAVIIFPHAGPSTQQEWIHSAFEQDLEVLAGAEMTHPRFKKSEGGYIDDESLARSYIISAKFGINNFVLPGNKPPEVLTSYIRKIEEAVPKIEISAYSPGLIAQGGKIDEKTKLFKRWYCILGRASYGDIDKIGRYFNEREMRESAFDSAKQL